MGRSIIGVTVGTPINPHTAVEKTEQAKQILRNKNDIADLYQSKSNAIINTLSGKYISMSDSDDAYLENLRVFGRSEQKSTNGYQLFDASKFATHSQGGATVTNNGDGSFTVSGSGNTTQTFQLVRTYSHEETIKLLKAGEVYVNESEVNPHFEVNFYSSAENFIISSLAKSGKLSGTITEDMLNDIYMKVYIYTGNGQPIVAGTFKPMFYQDGDGTWEPFTGHMASPNPQYPQEIESVGDSGSVGANVTGKNLFGGDALADKLVELSDATKDEANKTVTFSSNKVSGRIYFDKFKENTRYTFIITGSKGSGSDYSNLLVKYTDGSSDNLTFPNPAEVSQRVFISDEGKTVSQFCGTYRSGTTTLYYDKCGIFEGEITLDDFEPYTEQNITFNTENGLPAIKVTDPTLATYTDENGVMRCADEIDGGRKVYVQRIGEMVLDGSDDTKWSIYTVNGTFYTDGFTDYAVGTGWIPMCTHYRGTTSVTGTSKITTANTCAFLYNSSEPTARRFYIRDTSVTSVADFKARLAENPITVKYILAEPIETPLTDEEIAAYNALRTNYPNTTVLSDAHVEITYVADTKKYIDRKFAELAAALV